MQKHVSLKKHFIIIKNLIIQYYNIQTLISFATWDFPEPGKPLSIITILDGLLSRPGGHNNVSIVNNFRLYGFTSSLTFDILGGDGARILMLCCDISS